MSPRPLKGKSVIYHLKTSLHLDSHISSLLTISSSRPRNPMAVQLTSPTFSTSPIYPRYSSKFPPISFLLRRSQTKTLTLTLAFSNRRRFVAVRASSQQQEQVEEARGSSQEEGTEWGKVSAVLFDMDGVLCDSEEPSRMAAVDVFAEMGVSVTTEDFVPFMGTGNVLGFLDS